MKKNKLIKFYLFGFIILLFINIVLFNKTIKNKKDHLIAEYKLKLNNVVRDIEFGLLKKNIDINTLSADTGLIIRFLNGELALKNDVDTVVKLMKHTLNIDIVYLLNTNGDVVSSSTFNDKGDTLEGNNYDFREYFIGSMEGRHMVYAALGVTTYRHGIYISSPVYNPNKSKINGVIVFKMGLTPIDLLMSKLNDPAIFTSPRGMILSTNNKKWLFKSKHLLDIADIKEKTNMDLHLIKNGKLSFPLSIDGWMIEVFPNHKSFELSFTEKWEFSFMFLSSLVLYLFMLFLHLQMQKRVELQKELKKYYLIIKQAPLSILITDSFGYIEYVNPFLEKTTGYKRKELLGQKPNILKTESSDSELYEEIWGTIQNKKVWKGDFYNKKKNNEEYWEKTIIAPQLSKKGSISNFIIIKEDITEKKELEEKLKYQAAVDEMTQVLNKRSGLLFLNKQLQITKRHNKQSLSLCYIDINDLKYVNDTFGHAEGDNLILLIIEVIKDKIRNSDTMSRIGGDEFLIIFPDCDSNQCNQLMSRICLKLNEINNSNKLPYKLSMSFGITQFNPEDEIDIYDLISQADNEMYQMKKSVKELKNNTNKINCF